MTEDVRVAGRTIFLRSAKLELAAPLTDEEILAITSERIRRLRMTGAKETRQYERLVELHWDLQKKIDATRPRRRGRPIGSKNKSTSEKLAETVAAIEKRQADELGHSLGQEEALRSD